MTLENCLSKLDLKSLEGTIHLRDIDVPPFIPPANYEKVEFSIEKNNFDLKLKEIIDPVFAKAEKLGYPSGIYTALYEAILNAYQHGNEENPSKKIEFYYHIDKDSANFLVVDEGGRIDKNFINYISEQKKKNAKQSFLDFYEFAGKKKPSSNNGTGLSFMHAYASEISYHKSEKNGLAVRMSAFPDKNSN